MSVGTGHGVPAPAAAPEVGALPMPLTFFLNVAERRAVLARLRKVDGDRAAALLRVLGISEGGGHGGEGEGSVGGCGGSGGER